MSDLPELDKHDLAAHISSDYVHPRRHPGAEYLKAFEEREAERKSALEAYEQRKAREEREQAKQRAAQRKAARNRKGGGK